jgi:ADP-heptose:LPS heptosyltransferase
MKIKNMFKRELNTLPPEVANRTDAEDISVTVKFKDNHFHHIMPDDNGIASELVKDAMEELNLQAPTQTNNQPPDQVVFHNRQAIGDILTMTAGVRDFKAQFPNTKVGVITTAMHIWDHNPNIDHTFRDQRHMVKIGPSFLTNRSNTWNLHMCNAFRVDMENKLKVQITQGPVRPDIWMTEEEYKRPPIIEGPYWVFIYGGEPGWPTKQYHRWQEVIDILKDDIKIVQLGVKNHPYPHLRNVLDYIGKTEDRNHGLRDLFNIFLHAQGSLGLVSMHMHLSAVFNNPCVVVAAAREPAWFTQYFGHQYVQTNGTMFCAETSACWKCKLEGCRNKVEYEGKEMPKCVEIIEPEEIAEAVRKYYKGGRLEYGKKIPNKFFKNIVKEPRVFSAPKVQQIDNEYLKKWGFVWGSGSVTDQDWIFMKGIFEEYKIKTVLEFGAGLSTLLMGTLANHITTYETMPGWINKIKNLADPKKHKFLQWDGKVVPAEPGVKYPIPKYDFAFVDGPAGGENREWSTKYASEKADLIIIHDAGRKPEREWQDKYLAKDFQLIAKGGHRCHLWKRREVCKVDDGRPLARMLTTCRGWGGSERSTCYIMQGLIDKGYRVELAPTGNISGEYLKNIPKGVEQVRFQDVVNPADILVLYASDTIWGYGEEKWQIMNSLNCKKKIMVLNYKLGGAGQVPWTMNWNKYLFLSSSHKDALLHRIPTARTRVMAPPTDLTEFFKVKPDYGYPLRLIRHSSQGDNKWPEYTNELIRDILRINSATEFHFMPSRSDCMDHPQVYKYPKNKPPVYEFLKNGNCFWYTLPPGYTEGGPRVILEAMAAGLPVICDNHSGMADRVTDETGFRCNNLNEMKEAIKLVSSGNGPVILENMGKAARERAKTEFTPERWIEEIISQ